MILPKIYFNRMIVLEFQVCVGKSDQIHPGWHPAGGLWSGASRTQRQPLGRGGSARFLISPETTQTVSRLILFSPSS